MEIVFVIQSEGNPPKRQIVASKSQRRNIPGGPSLATSATTAPANTLTPNIHSSSRLDRSPPDSSSSMNHSCPGMVQNREGPEFNSELTAVDVILVNLDLKTIPMDVLI